MSCMRVLSRLPRYAHCVAWSSDGRLIAVGLYRGGIVLLDATSGVHAAELDGHTSCVRSVAFSPPNEGKQTQLLASCSDDKTVRLWSIISGECVRVLEGHSNWVMSVAFSPCVDSSKLMLASGSYDNTIRLWTIRGANDVVHGSVLRGHDDSVFGVTFSADGALLASASCDTVRLWHVPDGAPGHVLRGHTDFIWCVVFSPVKGSHLLASGSYDKTVRLWDGDSGELMYELRGHDAPVLHVAFSLDGTQLAAGSRDKTVRLWSVSQKGGGTLRRTLSGHNDDVFGVDFAPSGKQVVSCGYERTVRLWTVCKWSDHTHRLFGDEFKALVFQLMCIRERLACKQNNQSKILFLPMEMWLLIFECLQQTI